MATFVPISYTYVPTAPRSKSVTARGKPSPKQSSIFDKIQRIKLSGAALSTPQPAAVVAAAADDRGDRPGIRGTGTVHGGSDKENDDENDDDDRDIPTIEELLLTKLQEQGFTTEDRGLNKTGGVEEVASEERGGSVDQSRSAQSDNSGGSPDDPIVLLGDDDASASEAEVDDVSLRAESTPPDAGLVYSPETAIDSTIPAPLPSSDGWYDINDFPETAQRLRRSEQNPSTSDSMRPPASSSRSSSEPLHDHISTADQFALRARSEAMIPHPTCSRSQLPDHLPTDRSAVDKHELVRPALISDIFDEDRQRQVEEDEAYDDDNEDRRQPQQEVKDVAATLMTRKVSDTHLFSKKDESPGLANRDPSPGPSQDGAGSDSHSDDELNNTNSHEEEEPRPIKRKWPSSSRDGPMHKKRKHLQQRSTRQYRPHSKPHGRSPKSHFPLDQGSTVAAVSSTKGRLPSPAPSSPQATDTDMSPDCCNLDQSSRAVLPTLTEVTFRPYSQHCCSFTAVIREGCDGRGVSFSQVIRLITSIGHVGKINDFMIKPVEQHSFLLTGFSRHTSSRLSSSGTTLSTAVEADPILDDAPSTILQYGRTVDTRTVTQQGSEPASSDDDSGLSDNDGCSSEDEQKHSSTRMNIPWEAVDEQRLLAYKKEDKSWDWIFGKFPGRTPAAVRTRWTMVQRKVK